MSFFLTKKIYLNVWVTAGCDYYRLSIDAQSMTFYYKKYIFFK